MKSSTLGTLAVLVTSCALSIGCAAQTDPDAAPADLDSMVGDENGGVETNTYRPGAYTQAMPIVENRAPFSGDFGTGPGFGADSRFGLLSAGGDSAVAGNHGPTAIVFSFFSAPPAESAITTEASVDIESARARVIGTLFGFGKSHVEAKLRVVDMTTNTAVCESPTTILTGTEGALGEHNGGPPPASIVLSCSFAKDAGSTRFCRSDVFLTSYYEAWGGAWAEAHATAYLRSVRWRRSVEADRFIGHQGYCVEPSGLAVAGASVRLVECESRASQRWDRYASGAIRHIASGLCLDVGDAPAVDGTLLRLAACTPTAPRAQARFTGDIERFLSAANGKCLTARAPTVGTDYLNSPIVLSTCLSARPAFQNFAIH